MDHLGFLRVIGDGLVRSFLVLESGNSIGISKFPGIVQSVELFHPDSTLEDGLIESGIEAILCSAAM